MGQVPMAMFGTRISQEEEEREGEETSKFCVQRFAVPIFFTRNHLYSFNGDDRSIEHSHDQRISRTI